MGIIRKTKAVEILLKEFNNNHLAISAKKLINQLDSTINKTTIYRVLDKLEDDGVLHSFLGKEGLKWYAKCHNGCSVDKHSDFHPHFQCLNCNTIECLPNEVHFKIPNNYIVENVNCVLTGTCSNCL